MPPLFAAEAALGAAGRKKAMDVVAKKTTAGTGSGGTRSAGGRGAQGLEGRVNATNAALPRARDYRYAGPREQTAYAARSTPFPKRIGTLMAVLMMGLALIFDGLQIVFDLAATAVIAIPVVGEVLGPALAVVPMFLSWVGSIVFLIWFTACGVSYTNGKRALQRLLALMGEAVGESIPLVDALPLLSADILFTIYSSWQEDKEREAARQEEARKAEAALSARAAADAAARQKIAERQAQEEAAVEAEATAYAEAA